MKNLLILLFVLPFIAAAQFKYDNVLYKTVYWEEFCKQIQQQKDALVLDVRSLGEYNDTSRSSSLNIGHLKGAKHINVTELGNRIHELDEYKDKPIYVYCSHSQRSRRSSKMLADSGFTNVYNINGGLTDLYLESREQAPCKSELVISANAYTQLSPKEVVGLLQSQSSVQVVDVRKDSIFNGWSGTAKDKALGKLKGAINIPLSNLESSLNKLNKNKAVLLVDAGGDEASKAATLLVNNGFKDVMISFDGLEAWRSLPESDKKFTAPFINQNIGYHVIDAEVFDEMAKRDVVIVDIRSSDEFNNTATPTWRNRGHIKNAINVPLEIMESNYSQLPKEKPVILYYLSNTPESYQAAELLASKGYSNIYLLAPGIWGLRYKAFNSPNSSRFKDWMVDIPEENL